MLNSAKYKKGHLHKLNFNLDLLEHQNISPFYSQLFNIETDEIIHLSEKSNSSTLDNNAFFINDIPNYLNTEINTTKKHIKLKKTPTYQGSLINLKAYNALDDYLLDKIRTKERAEIRRRQKRLDLCIKPSYKVFYGNITKEEYDIIFNDYKQMLIRRLEQKQSYWEELDYWQDRYDSSLELINKKKACIFVIYNKEIPIAIYINSIYDKIIFNEVVAYDIDYSRFNIGILIFIKIIEWSIDNGFSIIDMSKGDFHYKERFRNNTYTFENHIIYDSRNVFVTVKASVLKLKIDFIYRLLPLAKKLKINKLYTLFKRYKKKSVFEDIKNEQNQIEIKKLNILENTKDLDLIDINNKYHVFLKKTFIDFAFLNSEYIDDILVYKRDNTYIFKGNKSLQENILK